jgi:hypothetical protein
MMPWMANRVLNATCSNIVPPSSNHATYSKEVCRYTKYSRNPIKSLKYDKVCKEYSSIRAVNSNITNNVCIVGVEYNY